MNKNIPFKLGHVLIQVDNLETAISQYRQMGFQVVPGGPPEKMHNALIYLKDGTFLELFCTNYGKLVNAVFKFIVKMIGISDQSYSSRLGLYLPGEEGLKDYALNADPVCQYENNIEKVRNNGLIVSAPRPKARIERHGIKLKWTLSCPENVVLPFLMSEFQPPVIVGSEDHIHPNGALGIHEIYITTSQWDKTYGDYSLMLGMEPKVKDEQSGRSCLFPMKGTNINLAEKDKDGIEQVIISCDCQSNNKMKFAAVPTFIVMPH
ncbi:VOC family protein [Clostridium sp. E02]|uniref:VOC family protein n=1 Tax=Clostridium sp. E02 TaxID=2487134 RepID=UPI000F534252|nr:VOC family protein [Clostridium sp. E02]